jgi:hypothetical protein
LFETVTIIGLIAKTAGPNANRRSGHVVRSTYLKAIRVRRLGEIAVKSPEDDSPVGVSVRGREH